MPSSVILPLEAVEAVYRDEPWSFAIEQRAEIDRRWAVHAAGNPHFFNGTVLIQHDWRIEDGIYRTAYGPVDYASFLIWRELGFPGPPRRNGFAMAAMRSRDGAFILGVMGAHTANAGKIYFAAARPT